MTDFAQSATDDRCDQSCGRRLDGYRRDREILLRTLPRNIVGAARHYVDHESDTVSGDLPGAADVING
jgi:hypothetical protein